MATTTVYVGHAAAQSLGDYTPRARDNRHPHKTEVITRGLGSTNRPWHGDPLQYPTSPQCVDEYDLTDEEFTTWSAAATKAAEW